MDVESGLFKGYRVRRPILSCPGQIDPISLEEKHTNIDLINRRVSPRPYRKAL